MSVWFASCRASTAGQLLSGLTADCDVHPAALTEDDNGYYTFDLCTQGNTLAHVKMGVPGRFNVENGAGGAHCGVGTGRGI